MLPDFSSGVMSVLENLFLQAASVSYTHLDEPTGALDSKASRLLLETMADINKKMQATILMVTHLSLIHISGGKPFRYGVLPLVLQLRYHDICILAYGQDVYKRQGIYGNGYRRSLDVYFECRQRS